MTRLLLPSSRAFTNSLFVGAFTSLFVVPWAVSCDPDDPDPSTSSPDSTAIATSTETSALLAPAGPAEMHTYIQQALQIDQIGAGPGDANLVTGDDVDGSASANLPTSSSTFIDWSDLGGDLADHQLLDLSDASGRDASAFPGSNECVAPANVLSKMDLTWVGVANNAQYAYFGVQRSANNGDAGYYWVFTKKAPQRIRGEAPCAADKDRLVYNVTGPRDGATGDVLITGHFKPGGAPLVDVYQATRDAAHVPATAVVDDTSTLWRHLDSAASAVAVNTTIAAPGAFGAAGVRSLVGDNLDTELFAEAAVPLSTFTGGASCGATYYGSVITRSSGSGGTSPDLKDLAGPALFNFGSIAATATTTTTCGYALRYALTSATGVDGETLPNPSCAWKVDGVDVPGTACTGSTDVAATENHATTVTVTDPVTQCQTTWSSANVKLYPPLAVDADLVAHCRSGFTYAASTRGGSPSGVDVAWTFSGPGTVTPASSSATSGSAVVDETGVAYAGHVVVTDRRTDGLVYTASDEDDATPLSPLSVQLIPSSEGMTCPAMATDAVAYAALPSGGDGDYAIAWRGASCSGTTCTIDPASDAYCVGPLSLTATVTDGSGLCAAATSETETYTKTTTVTATNN
jgi:hypothetical protein